MTDASKLDWDDFRLVLTIGRSGGLAAAGRALSINHATVFRKVNALEARLQAPLFERRRGGYVMTALGEQLFRSAERMEEQVLALDRSLAGEDPSLTGHIRLTAPDDMVHHLLMPILKRFRDRYPGILLDVTLDNRFLSLTRREADIAIRATSEPPDGMVGINIGGLSSAAYAARSLVEGEAGTVKDWQGLPWVGWEDGQGPRRFTEWLAASLPPERIVYRSNSLLNQLAAVAEGIGAGILPCFLGDGDTRLRRLDADFPRFTAELWLLTHPDLRRAPRIKAFLDFFGTALRRQRDRLAGPI